MKAELRTDMYTCTYMYVCLVEKVGEGMHINVCESTRRIVMYSRKTRQNACN